MKRNNENLYMLLCPGNINTTKQERKENELQKQGRF